MEFFKKTPQIRFMARRKWFYAISIALTVLTFVLLAVRGLNLGLDFTGGVIVELNNPAEVSVQRVREALDQAGYNVEVQGASGGSRELIVRVPPQEGETAQNPNEVANAILETLKTDRKSVV